MKSKIFLMVVLSTWVSPELSFGDIPQKISILDAYHELLGRSPTVRQARELINQSEAEARLAFSKLFFTFGGSLTAEHKKDGLLVGSPSFGGEYYNLYNAEMKLTQPIYAGGSLWGGYQAALSTRDVNSVAEKIAERNATQSLLTSYFQAHFSQDQVKTIEATLKVEQEAIATTRQRAQIGRSQKLDLLQIQTQVALLEAQLAQAKADAKTSISNLLSVLDMTDVRDVDLTTDLESFELQDLINRVKKEPFNVLEFESIEKQFNLLSEQKSVDLGTNLPQLSFIGTLDRNAYTKSGLTNNDANQWNFEVQLQIPIFSGFSLYAQRSQYAAKEKELEEQSKLVRDQVIASESQALHNLKAAEITLKSSELAFHLAEESVKEGTRNYRLSTIDYLVFLNVQQSYLTARTTLEQARLTYIQAVASYFVSTGHALEPLVQELHKRTKG